MMIRAKLRPLLNEERVEQTENMLSNYAKFTENHQKVLNRRKSLTKRVSESFTVNHDEVRQKINEKTKEQNLPSNRYLQGGAQETLPVIKKKPKGRKNGKNTLKPLIEPSDVVGWTEISEEQDFANSDFEAMIDNKSPQKLSKRNSKRGKKLQASQGYLGSANSLHIQSSHRSGLGSIKENKGSITNVQLLPAEDEIYQNDIGLKSQS